MADDSTYNDLASILLQQYAPKQEGSAPYGVVATDPSRSQGGFYRPNGDHAYYLPKELVGDLPYRYQGVALHGGMAAHGAAGALDGLASKLAGGRFGAGGWLGLLSALANAGYVGWTIGTGRTAPKPKVDDPTPANSLAEILRNRLGEGYEDPRLGMDSADYDTSNVLSRMK